MSAIAFRIGAVLETRHWFRRPWILLGLVGMVVAIAVAWVERSVAKSGAIDRALLSFFGVVVPLYACAAVHLFLPDGKLFTESFRLSRWGGSLVAVTFGRLASFSMWLSITCSAMSVVIVLVAHSAASSPPMLRDIVACFEISFMTGFAYAGWYVLSSQWFQGGKGRWVFLAVDLLLGSTSSTFAMLFPKAHALNLSSVGENAPFSHIMSFISLALMGIGANLLAIRLMNKRN